MSSSLYSPNADAFSFDRTVSSLKQGMESASTATSDASQKATQAGKDFMVYSQGNMEAFAQASQLFVAGSQDLFRQMAEAGQTAVQEAMGSLRAVSLAKTAKERIELQATFARTAAIHAVTESARIAQSAIDLAERVSNPLVARTVIAVEAMSPASR